MIAALCREVSPPTLDQAESPAVPADVREGLPDADWTRDELDRRAAWEVDKTRRQHSSAAAYWWLGKVLVVVKAGFESAGDEQGWADWRERHHVNRTRAYRSYLYIGAFKSVELLPLTVKKADLLARELTGEAEPQTEEEQRIRRRLLHLKNRTLPDSLKDLALVEDPTRLLTLIAEADELWREFQQAIKRQLAGGKVVTSG